MRPVRLELEGFGPYRDHTVVDFTGADLFALTGPTGSGKSSIIDAICFALYGSIPRYDDRRLVAPAISQGMAEALVRLELTIDGQSYTAVRLVKRTKTGATTKEARLERDGVVLAGNEKELTAEVERILGLTYEHFTKCVVLPQGEFARFLHDKPDRRQELLVELLDLGVYGRMATLAHQRARDAERDVAAIADRLAGLADATAEARAAAEARLAALAEVRTALEGALPELEALAVAAATARADGAAARRDMATIEAIDVPSDLADREAARREATERLASAAAALSVAIDATVAAEAGLAVLGDRPELEQAQRGWAERAKQSALVAKGEASVDVAARELAKAVAAEAPALAELEVATAAVEKARVEHAAHALRDHLVVGEPCAVCEQRVTTLPSSARPADLDAAERGRAAASERVVAAAKLRSEATSEHERVAAKLETVRAQLAELESALADAPAAAEVEAQLDAIVAAEAALVAARAAERQAQQVHSAATKGVDALRAAEATALTTFLEGHATVAALGAPVPTGDLSADWGALAAWIAAAIPERSSVVEEAEARADALEADRRSKADAVADRCRAVGVATSGDLRDSVVSAHTSAGHDVERIDAALAAAAQLRLDQAAAEATRDVARELHRHLGSRGFERWLLDEALAQLVLGATATLLELSGDQYSLTLDDRGFAVVDHRNADQVRSARTLSGGETFLASLALALALADQLALMAGRGGARLESLFLDEGFGTLDPDTLDTVAGAIEELGARGRMVGLISHVPELAERVPVRFDVRKHGNAATIERVDQ